MRMTMPRRELIEKNRFVKMILTDFRLANRLLLKVADLSAVDCDYYKAIEIYEKLAKRSIDNNLMRYSVKE